MINSDKNKMKKFTIILSVLVTIAMTTNAQWQLANGPYGGKVASIATSGSNIFAGTYDGVFWYPLIMEHHGQQRIVV